MSAAYELLETLQEDTIAVLKSTPTLAHANIIAEQNGDLESEVERLLGFTKSGTGGKRGLVLVVMQPEVTSAEANLPGPPMIIKQEIQVIEHPRINRTAAGTNLRSSHAALLALNALHLHGMGGHATYAEDKPIEPLPMKDGLVSHVVSVFARANGLQGPGKAGAVEVAMDDGVSQIRRWSFLADSAATAGNFTFTITSALLAAPEVVVVPIYEGEAQKGTAFTGRVLAAMTGNANMAAAGMIFSLSVSLSFLFLTVPPTDNDASLNIQVAHDTDRIVSAVSVTTQAGRVPYITYTCATAGASIRYTTDGSYPTPDKGTLYSAPFAAPPVGTTVRAAAYKTGLNPGDCLEFNITA
jgi:hypothetical protein